VKAGGFPSLAMVALLVFATLAGAVLAAGAQPQAPQKSGGYAVAQEKYQRAMQMYRSARQEYMGSRGMFRGPPVDMLRQMLLRTIDAMLAHIELVRARAESSTLTVEEKAEVYRRLDSHAEFLKQKRQEVQEAETRGELMQIAREVRGRWSVARMELKLAAGTIAVSRVEYILDRGEEIGDRVEMRIKALEQAGYSTGELEELLAQYRMHLSAARNETELAGQKFSAITSPASAGRLFREGRENLREAQVHLRSMFRTLREIIERLRQGEAEVSGVGHLYARGNGTVVIQGTGGVYLRGSGNLTVRVERGGTKLTGWSRVAGNPDGSLTYTGSGRAKVYGRGIYLRAEGEGLVVRASGRGTALLRGDGTWRASGTGGSWSGEVRYGGR